MAIRITTTPSGLSLGLAARAGEGTRQQIMHQQGLQDTAQELSRFQLLDNIANRAIQRVEQRRQAEFSREMTRKTFDLNKIVEARRLSISESNADQARQLNLARVEHTNKAEKLQQDTLKSWENMRRYLSPVDYEKGKIDIMMGRPPVIATKATASETSANNILQQSRVIEGAYQRGEITKAEKDDLRKELGLGKSAKVVEFKDEDIEILESSAKNMVTKKRGLTFFGDVSQNLVIDAFAEWAKEHDYKNRGPEQRAHMDQIFDRVVEDLNKEGSFWGGDKQVGTYSWNTESEEVQKLKKGLIGAKEKDVQDYYREYLQGQGKYDKKLGRLMSQQEFKNFARNGFVRVQGKELQLSPEQEKYRKSIRAWRQTLGPDDIITPELLGEVATGILGNFAFGP
jgi:hypothetical protein